MYGVRKVWKLIVRTMKYIATIKFKFANYKKLKWRVGIKDCLEFVKEHQSRLISNSHLDTSNVFICLVHERAK